MKNDSSKLNSVVHSHKEMSDAETLRLDRKTLESRSLRVRSALRAGEKPIECTEIVIVNT
jgi:hypothetical protein